MECIKPQPCGFWITGCTFTDGQLGNGQVVIAAFFLPPILGDLLLGSTDDRPGRAGSQSGS